MIKGEQGGISKAVNWQGGVLYLGRKLFGIDGAIHPEVKSAKAFPTRKTIANGSCTAVPYCTNGRNGAALLTSGD